MTFWILILGSDGHESKYHTKWVIEKWTKTKLKVEPYTCFGEDFEKLLPRVSYGDMIHEETQKELIRSILKYGVGIVTNVSKDGVNIYCFFVYFWSMIHLTLE